MVKPIVTIFYDTKVHKQHYVRRFHPNITAHISSKLFCSLAVLDPRVGHTMDVLSPFIPVLCHSD